MGAWFPKDKGREIFKPLDQWGKFKCQRENPSNCQLPILSLVPNHLILRKICWVSYCMGWARYGGQNLKWVDHQFLAEINDWAQKTKWAVDSFMGFPFNIWIFPIGSKVWIPPPLSLGNHAPISLMLHWNSCLWVFN